MRIGSVTTTVLGLAIAAASVAVADHELPLGPDLTPKIDEIISPLSGAPAIVQAGDEVRIELAPERLSFAGEPTATLRPSFGEVRPIFTLDLIEAMGEGSSQLWPGRQALAFRFAVPPLEANFVEDLYDLTVTFGPKVDTQHRSVKVVETFPEVPRFVVLADPSVGDPRPVQEGAEDLSRGDSNSLIDKTVKTVGNPMNEDRWAALNRAIDEINILRPDFVLVTGDLTFALYPRQVNYEYEDAYRILARLQVPTFLSPGNHDLYHFEYDNLERPWLTDGWELWQSYFGPLYYARDLTPDIRLLSLNTFDWPYDEREPFDEDDEFSTRAGGQIQPEQFAWIADQIEAIRQDDPDKQIITLAHHDPSWIQARHPWAGINRLETRDLFAQGDVGVHFAGHTHEDRVARYHLGDVVETNGRKGPKNILQRVLRNNQLDPAPPSQEDLGQILRDPSHGPLFVTTTTVSSVLKGSDWGLGSYWGYRYGTLDEVAGGGYDPASFGYPATREFIDSHAERPEWYNPDHAQFGVYSYPSYELDIERKGNANIATVTLESRLLADVTVHVPVSLAAPTGTVVAASAGAQISWTRRDGEIADALVRISVPAGQTLTITVQAT
jgi:hypothetical protein